MLAAKAAAEVGVLAVVEVAGVGVARGLLDLEKGGEVVRELVCAALLYKFARPTCVICWLR